MVSQLHRQNDSSLANYSNSCWFVDFTLLDINIADTTGSVIGKPYLTIVIDIYSQCCMGFCLSLKSPNNKVVTQALRHAILPKRYNSEYNLNHEWRTYGIPVGLCIDSSNFTNSYSLQEKVSQLGIRLHTHQPRFKSNYCTEKICLTIISNLQASRGLSGEDDFVTLEVIEKILVHYIVNNFNQQSSTYLSGSTRQEMWEAGLISMPQIIQEHELDI
ncbi:integrase catalytic domain-containing protein [Nostoc sp. NZL]|uniref:integrase catalytic domain-containing protein n=1 Tax=Nostoc sp. NZL TaxID=2650612 RepID=UPI0018C6B14F|nr:DDE-type integrase/transposase/recombinase [Nostoc sp. NZL]MBG1245522.1 transposase family protein [Nostoc sp. NZL]